VRDPSTCQESKSVETEHWENHFLQPTKLIRTVEMMSEENKIAPVLNTEAKSGHSTLVTTGLEHFDLTHTAHAHNPSIRFEEYMYYASITRAEEKAAEELHQRQHRSTTVASLLKDRFSKGRAHRTDSPVERERNNGENESAVITGVTSSEWKNASRAVRTAGWSAVFYLITTDILGPFSTPYVRNRCLAWRSRG
jgi:hypothetical protein